MARNKLKSIPTLPPPEECHGRGLANNNAWMLRNGEQAMFVGLPGDHIEVIVNGHIVLDLNWKE